MHCLHVGHTTPFAFTWAIEWLCLTSNVGHLLRANVRVRDAVEDSFDRYIYLFRLAFIRIALEYLLPSPAILASPLALLACVGHPRRTLSVVGSATLLGGCRCLF